MFVVADCLLSPNQLECLTSKQNLEEVVWNEALFMFLYVMLGDCYNIRSFYVIILLHNHRFLEFVVCLV